MAWLASQPDTKRPFEESVAINPWKKEDSSEVDDIDLDTVDQIFARMASNQVTPYHHDRPAIAR